MAFMCTSVFTYLKRSTFTLPCRTYLFLLGVFLWLKMKSGTPQRSAFKNSLVRSSNSPKIMDLIAKFNLFYINFKKCHTERIHTIVSNLFWAVCSILEMQEEIVEIALKEQRNRNLLAILEHSHIFAAFSVKRKKTEHSYVRPNRQNIIMKKKMKLKMSSTVGVQIHY